MSEEAKIEDLKDERVPVAMYWTQDDIVNWIEKIGFPQYKDCFLSNGVDGKKLIIMEASALPKLGITDFEHIKIIVKSVRELLSVEEPYWDRSITIAPRSTLGCYLERKSCTGVKSSELTYQKYAAQHPNLKWRPPLNNHCLILPHD